VSRTHQLKEYLKYSRKASGRHGVHSPFVYELTEQLLKRRLPAANLMLATSRHKRMVNKIITYFGCKHILWITNKDGEAETYIAIEEGAGATVKLRTERFNFAEFSSYPAPELYLLDLAEPADWVTAWEKYKDRIRPDDIVLITSIHHSAAHTAAWEQVHTDDRIKLSVDLFKLGLLFFKEEFKEKQHFVLKARL